MTLRLPSTNGRLLMRWECVAARIAFLCALAVSLSSCGSGSSTGFTGIGTSASYVPGLPNFDMDVQTLWEGDRAGMELSLNLPNASLVFIRSADAFLARFEITVVLFAKGTSEIVRDEVWIDEVSAATYEETQRFETRSVRRSVHTDPGEYVVAVKVLDLNSNKAAVRRQAIRVHDLGEAGTAVSSIRLEVLRGDGSFASFEGFHLGQGGEEFRALIRVYNVPRERPTTVRLALLRFEGDTSVARPPFAFSPFIGSFPVSGVSFADPESVQTFYTPHLHAVKDTTLVFLFRNVPKGIYRMDVEIGEPPDTVLREERLFSLLGRDFPRPQTLEGLIEPLRYLAKEEEMENILEATDPGERRRRFDAFWLGIGKNATASANLIKQYYSRVEMANRYFSSHKEGWKTDRGMLYVVLGPPISREERPDIEVWRYSYADNDPLNTFVFRRYRGARENPYLETFQLLRQSYYDTMWERMIRRWRAGQVF